MKKILFLISLFIAFNSLMAQEVKLSKVKENTRYGKAIYYVLKEKPEVKNGKYVIKSWGGKHLLIEGNYENNKKVGTWTERYSGRDIAGKLKSQGDYKNNTKVGIWNYYDTRNNKVQTYDYDKDELVFSINRIDSSLKMPAEYVSGFNALYSNIESQINWPSELNTKGTNTFDVDTKIKITIDTNGLVKDIKFSKEIGYGNDERVKNWILEENNLWIPAYVEGEIVESSITVPLKYRMMF
ncbi:MAG: hypothetical protein HND54_14075 [Bacteroidetes bacterium]|nr:hypothetical protein [Bacteroidota bacterium]